MTLVAQVVKPHGGGGGSGNFYKIPKLAKFSLGNERYGDEYDAGSSDYVPRKRIRFASPLADYDRKPTRKSGGLHVKGGAKNRTKGRSGSVPGSKQGEYLMSSTISPS